MSTQQETMAYKPTHLRNLLLKQSEWMEEQVLQAAKANGYGFITPSMNRLFAHMGGKPIGLSELARRMAVSRQAVHQIANEAIRHGLVEMITSEMDARVKLLRFSTAGWAMSQQAGRDFDLIETELAQRIGASQVTELRRVLSLDWAGREPPKSVKND